MVPDAPLAGTDQDIYISSDGMGSAMNGDRVEVQVLRAKPDGRREGRILRVTDRAQKTVVGQFHCGQRYNFVMPFDHRIPFEIVIPRGEEWPGGESPAPARSRDRQFGGESEQQVRGPKSEVRSRATWKAWWWTLRSTSYPRPAALPRGRVVEILGRREDFGVDVEIVIRKFHLPHRFPAGGAGGGRRRAAIHPGARPRRPPRLPRTAHRDHRRRDGQGF